MTHILETSRLSFRLMDQSDFDDLYSLDSDPEVRSFFSSGTLNKDQVLEKITKNQTLFKTHGFCDFIVSSKDNEFLGRAGFGLTSDHQIQIGYLFLKKFWGLGYATETTSALLKWGFDHLPYDRFIAFAPLDHISSHNVMQKCGMTYFKTDDYQGVPFKFFEIHRG